MLEAQGTFTLKMTPGSAPADGLSSFSLDKTYTGDLVATYAGQMLSAGDPKTGNAGYVALERITGALASRTGSFAVMQSGTMTTGSAPYLAASIVPGSGTGALTGISGTLSIDATDGTHHYSLHYRLD